MTRKLLFILLASAVCFTALPLVRGGDLTSDSTEGAALFDGVAKRRSQVGGPSAVKEDKALLTAELKKHVTIDDNGNPAERAAMDSMIARMLDSVTAREVAKQFIKEDAKVVVTFEDIPGSTVATENGKKVLWGTRGSTSYEEGVPRVTINKFFMRNDRDQGVGTLAHEMLGHALERQRAGENLKTANSFTTSEEENARLIGWLVRTELGVKPEDEIWAYVQDPSAGMESLKITSPAYAKKLTMEEMREPIPVYKERLVAVEKALANIPARTAVYKRWLKIVGHLVKVHEMEAAPFRTIKADINNALKYLPEKRKDLLETKGLLQKLVELFSDEKIAAQFAEDFSNDYFVKKEATMKERRARLEVLLAGKTQESSEMPPEAGQLSWDQLDELWVNDKKTCDTAGEIK